MDRKKRLSPLYPARVPLRTFYGKSQSVRSCALTVTAVEPMVGKVACLIKVSNRWILATNDRERTSPKYRRSFKDGFELTSEHAEMRALQMARKIGGKIKEVVVLRWRMDGVLSMARPCRKCQEFLINHNVKSRDIYYSDWNGEIICMNGEDNGD